MNKKEVAKYIDLTPNLASPEEGFIAHMENMAEYGKKYGFKNVLAPPWYLQEMKAMLEGSGVGLLGPTGGIFGWDTTDVKLKQIAWSKDCGCDEIDTLMNINMFKSGRYDDVQKELNTLVKAAGSTPIKVIIEVPSLTDEEAVKASLMVRDAGAAYVKMNVGSNGIATVAQTKAIKDAVGDTLKVKACGTDNYADFSDLLNYGIERFGIGFHKVEMIFSELDD